MMKDTGLKLRNILIHILMSNSVTGYVLTVIKKMYPEAYDKNRKKYEDKADMN